ncbi:UNVERIFIED_CONTAM: putative late blight resistance proteinR1B-12 [Sesamum radiatum]|uniref:Late blight resistance proteinR1B-12 n=1 Tax=Sesamum radiatum TaxID=300843 RepID=A0AAW2RXS7_SESRA
MGNLDSAKEEMMTIMDNSSQIADSSSPAVSSRQDPNPKNIIVGVGEDLIQLKDRLIGQPSKALHVIPIVGMGGIGRRYLIVLDDVWDVKPWDETRRFFPDDNNGSRIIVTTRESSVAYYTGSQSSYHQMNLLKDDESWNLLHRKVFAPEDTCSSELGKIGKKIAKYCRGLPLVVHVIGGILSQAKTNQDFWEQVSDNVTSTVADKGEQYSNILSLCYNRLPNHLKPIFLYMGAFPEDYEIRSSKLIKLLVAEGFVQPISGKSLEETAKMHLKALVDRNLIFVRQQGTNGNVKSYSIHDLLRDLCARKACEEKFLFIHGCELGNLPINTSFLRRKQYLNILCLSYNYVPYHLKPCLLYMSAFPEGSEIHASKLIKLWVAEGFLKPISGKSLEEAAETYLKALVDRNLIFIRQQSPEGNVKSYSIHDILRDLCVTKAHLEENFLVLQADYMPGLELWHSVLSIQDIDDIEFNPMFTRSFLFTGVGSQQKLFPSVLSTLELLRVLDILGLKFHRFPKEILQLINLRYLALSTSKLPSSISRLWNLQILIFQSIALSPMLRAMMPEILGMAQLRHIKLKGFYVWYDDKYVEHSVFQDELHSLSTIAISQLTDRFLRTIPNLEKLGIFCDEEVDHVKDLSCFHKLRTLKCTSYYDGGNLLSKLIFPHSLKKLSLRDCGILDLDMNRIADDTHFPRLEQLVIRHCLDLEAIPLAIGDIPTLQVIEVHNCSPSVMDSARMVQKEQLSIGNDGLEVRLSTWLQKTSIL